MHRDPLKGKQLRKLRNNESISCLYEMQVEPVIVNEPKVTLEVENVLNQLSELHSELKSLPPKRTIDHKI